MSLVFPADKNDPVSFLEESS